MAMMCRMVMPDGRELDLSVASAEDARAAAVRVMQHGQILDALPGAASRGVSAGRPFTSAMPTR